ncbi:MAG: dihydroxyacetone kinase subunit DhaK, partial [Deferribacteraceae bacterium]|nr:dihydroxyacetone kinase subunit DhaK [Deferribacteraceae bacterium]
MNKLINHVDNTVPEMLDGYLRLNSEHYEAIPDVMGLKRKQNDDKVSVVIAGGGGNEPWVIGFVGEGLADGAALGNVYMAPPARSVLKVARVVPNAKGVLFVATNHAGDVLNFELVRELAELEGITAECVYAADDISSAPLDRRDERRGT